MKRILQFVILFSLATHLVAQLAAPVFKNPESNVINSIWNVTTNTYPSAFLLVIVPPAGATACYTTDGSTPTAPSAGTCSGGTTQTYSVPFNIPGTVTVKAISTQAAHTNSSAASVTITLQPFYPLPTGTTYTTQDMPGMTYQANGTYAYSPVVTLAGTFGSNLIYTTDGTTPTVSGTCTATNGTAAANGTQITVSTSETIKFIPCIGGVTGAMQTGVYTIRSPVTWYVRADGGGIYDTNRAAGSPFTGINGIPFSGQAIGCDGQHDAAWTSGTNQPCALNDFRFLYDDQTPDNSKWIPAGGDTIVVEGCATNANQPYNASPDCRIGFDKPTYDGSPAFWCYGLPGNQLCFNPPPPSGSVAHPTIIEGVCAVTNTCHSGNSTINANLSQLFGGFGVLTGLNLYDSQNVIVNGLEVTTHNGACSDSGTPSYPTGCIRTGASTSDYGADGFKTNNYTIATLTDVYEHGGADSGIHGPIGNMTMTRVFVGFNGFAGWNFADTPDTPDGVGATITANYVTMTGNGCLEQYPLVNTFPAKACWDDVSGGFGDSWSGQDSLMTSFVCNHCTMLYNTKDGFIGPHTLIGSLTIENSSSIGNMGEQWKWAQLALTFVNNLTVGNCKRFDSTLPGAVQSFNLSTGLPGSYLSDFCRAAGDMFSFSTDPLIPLSGSPSVLIGNNTNIGYNPTIFDFSCGPAGGGGDCTGVPYVLKNNLNLGYSEGTTPALYFINAGTNIVLTSTNNVEAFMSTSDTCGVNGIICTDPLLTSQPAQGSTPPESALDVFNPQGGAGNSFYPTLSSPALLAGTTYTGLPSTDFYGTVQTSPSVIGGVLPPGTPTVSTPTFSPVAGSYIGTQTVTISTTTGGATICYTVDGSTPAASTPGTCSHGTTYSTPVTVASSLTLKALGTESAFTNSAVASGLYTINASAATPTFSPVAGTYAGTQSVTISTTSGTVICYNTTGSPATNGTTGCTTGTLYTTPVSVSSSETLFAVAGGTGFVDSSVGSAAYVITAPQAAAPTFSPVAGSYTGSQSVTLASSSSGCSAHINWNTTGAQSGGNLTGTTLGTSVTVAGNETVYAQVQSCPAFVNSTISSAAYVIAVVTPTCTPPGGTYSSTQSVTCSSSDIGTTTYCTIDGSTPTTGSPVCTSISVANSLTLKAISAVAGKANSAILTQNYTITTAPPVTITGTVTLIGSSTIK